MRAVSDAGLTTSCARCRVKQPYGTHLECQDFSCLTVPFSLYLTDSHQSRLESGSQKCMRAIEPAAYAKLTVVGDDEVYADTSESTSRLLWTGSWPNSPCKQHWKINIHLRCLRSRLIEQEGPAINVDFEK